MSSLAPGRALQAERTTHLELDAELRAYLVQRRREQAVARARSVQRRACVREGQRHQPPALQEGLLHPPLGQQGGGQLVVGRRQERGVVKSVAWIDREVTGKRIETI